MARPFYKTSGFGCTVGGPIIGLRLHGFDPIFTCGLRIWQWFFYGLRLQHQVRLAFSAVNRQRFAAFGMRMRLPVERTACGQVIDFNRNGVKKISRSRRNMIRITKQRYQC